MTKTETKGLLAADLKQIAKDSQRLLRDSTDLSKQSANEMRERLAKIVDSARSSYRRLGEKAKDGARATDRVVREHPYGAIGLTFSVGLVMGLLFARRAKAHQ